MKGKRPAAGAPSLLCRHSLKRGEKGKKRNLVTFAYVEGERGKKTRASSAASDRSLRVSRPRQRRGKKKGRRERALSLKRETREGKG